MLSFFKKDVAVITWKNAFESNEDFAPLVCILQYIHEKKATLAAESYQGNDKDYLTQEKHSIFLDLLEKIEKEIALYNKAKINEVELLEKLKDIVHKPTFASMDVRILNHPRNNNQENGSKILRLVSVLGSMYVGGAFGVLPALMAGYTGYKINNFAQEKTGLSNLTTDSMALFQLLQTVVDDTYGKLSQRCKLK